MNEREWHSCSEPEAMLTFLLESGKFSDRKAQLFAAQCCRRIWFLLKDECSREAVELAERHAEGQAGADEVMASLERAWNVLNIAPLPASMIVDLAAAAAGQALAGAPIATANAVLSAVHRLGDSSGPHQQAEILRDLFGPLPFREIRIDAAWLSWHDGLAVRLAQAAYDERQLPAGTLDSGRLAVLADALEEAGCNNTDILTHLRAPGPHYRGCWAVDRILDKK
jgi:hypothetical protein